MTDYKKFKIFEFDLNDMVDNPSILIIGKRGVGKTWLVRELMYYFHQVKHIPTGIVIAPTDRMNPFYNQFFPDLYIHHDLNSQTIKEVLARQADTIGDKRSAKHTKKSIKDRDPSSLVVIDDALSMKKSWQKDENVNELLMNGRHYKLPYILCVQTPLGLAPDFRLNFDYIFICRDDSSINKKKLWDNYASVFPTFSSFEKVFNACTKDHMIMVIDNRKPCDNFSEKIFWIKSIERDFKFGSGEFRQISEKYYDPTYLHKSSFSNSDRIEELKINNRRKSKRYGCFINKNKLDVKKIKVMRDGNGNGNGICVDIINDNDNDISSDINNDASSDVNCDVNCDVNNNINNDITSDELFAPCVKCIFSDSDDGPSKSSNKKCDDDSPNNLDNRISNDIYRRSNDNRRQCIDSSRTKKIIYHDETCHLEISIADPSNKRLIRKVTDFINNIKD